MALNTPVTLFITTTLTSGQSHTMRFPGHQLGTAFFLAMQAAQIPFPEDESVCEFQTDTRDIDYMGLTHVRNQVVSTDQLCVEFLVIRNHERGTQTSFQMQLEFVEEEDDDDSVSVISVASSVSVNEDSKATVMPASG
jgi:hypothetical protein